MSSTHNFDDNTANLLSTQPPPTHHTHRSSDPIATAGPDYSPEVTNDPQAWKSSNERRFGAGTDTRTVMGGGQHAGDTAPSTNFDEGDSGDGRDAFTEDRPMNVNPSGAGEFPIASYVDLCANGIFSPKAESPSTEEMTCQKAKPRPLTR